MAFGVKPTHLDTHMGTVFARPDFFQAYRKVAREFGLPYLLPRLRAGSHPPAAPQETIASIEREMDPAEFTLDDLVMLEGDMTADQQMEFYLETLLSLRPGITQIIIHCGIEDPELRATTYSHARRDRDRQIFVDPQVRRLIESEEIRLITWREIGRRQRQYGGLRRATNPAGP
jgi:predicted glycoside hydrolase/deacetylase ChbG (UPF0249 family)